ncbi:MAG: metalloregulator ArsR/SmtB family transcription factor [Bacteroidales bacterium]|nr:metalloregulator ArsR/SmtB family transcription factor [Bacteroidales bacterium]
MNNNKSTDFKECQQELAEYGRILSHPARIAIIELLAEKKEIKTGDISEYLPLSRTTVSQHLKELRNAGVISGTIDGLKIHYCLNMDKLKEMQSKLHNLFESSISNFVCSCNC